MVNRVEIGIRSNELEVHINNHRTFVSVYTPAGEEIKSAALIGVLAKRARAPGLMPGRPRLLMRGRFHPMIEQSLQRKAIVNFFWGNAVYQTVVDINKWSTNFPNGVFSSEIVVFPKIEMFSRLEYESTWNQNIRIDPPQAISVANTGCAGVITLRVKVPRKNCFGVIIKTPDVDSWHELTVPKQSRRPIVVFRLCQDTVGEQFATRRAWIQEVVTLADEFVFIRFCNEYKVVPDEYLRGDEFDEFKGS